MSVQAMTWVFEHSAATEGNRLVLLSLANHAHADGSMAFPSVATVAHEARMSPRGAQKCLRKLEEASMIERTDKHSSGTNIYRVIMDESVSIGGGEHRSGVNGATPGGEPEFTQTVKEPSPSLQLVGESSDGSGEPRGRGVNGTPVKIDGKVVTAKEIELGQISVDAWNATTGHRLGAWTGRGKPSTVLKQAVMRIREYPHVTADDLRGYVKNSVANPPGFVDGPLSFGHVFGPHAFQHAMANDGKPKLTKGEKTSARVRELLGRTG